MRDLAFGEIKFVSGGADTQDSSFLTSEAMLGLGLAGLMISIPAIVGGAILGVPTLGLGFVVMAGGIVATVVSGAIAALGVVQTAISVFS